MSTLRRYRSDAEQRRWRSFVYDVIGQLDETRTAQDLSIADFGDRAEMRPDALRSLLAGERSLLYGPQLRTLYELADALNMEVELRLRPRNGRNGHRR